MKPAAELQPLLKELQDRRGNPVLLCHGTLATDLLPVLYRGLRTVGNTARLDLVLSTYGGSVTATRQIALLLREFTDRLAVLVPHRARSAGTLLCLSAEELVLSPIAELGPLDANMGATEAQQPGTPGIVSAEDIRAFPQMARDWFGVQRPEDGLQLLAMLSQRIFPASLSSFYRLDKLIRQVAGELLEYQLPDPADEQLRDRIVDQLVGGYHGHDYVLTRRDLRRLGLRVTDAGPEEERLLLQVAELLERAGDAPAADAPAADAPADGGPASELAGIIATVDFLACNEIRRGVPGSSGWRIEG